MDPNEVLKNARKAAKAIHAQEWEDAEGVQLRAEALAEAFEALDGWLSKGGFLPDSWRNVPLPPEADDPDQYVDDEPSGGPHP